MELLCRRRRRLALAAVVSVRRIGDAVGHHVEVRPLLGVTRPGDADRPLVFVRRLIDIARAPE